jgi:Co/Zn/Cd efflux system component
MHKHFIESRDPFRNRKITGILLLLLLSGFMIQFVGGLYAHSSSVMSDAFHMLVDGTSQFVYWLVLTIAVWKVRPPEWFSKLHPSLSTILQNLKTTSLWKLGDFVCMMLLFVAASSTIFLSIDRLAYPQRVQLEVSLPVVVIGLAVNLVNLLVLIGSRSQDDLKGVLLHVKSDLYHSIIILIGQLVVWGFGNQFSFVDSLLGLWLGAKMMQWSGELLKETMQGKQFAIKGVMVHFPALAGHSCMSHSRPEGAEDTIKEHRHAHEHKKKESHHCCSH